MNFPFEHILVPLDFTERNNYALSFVRDLVLVSTTRVSLIHVIEPIEDSGDTEVQAFNDRLMHDAVQQLRKCADQLVGIDITISNVNRIGKRAAEITNYVVEEGVDLVLLNSHAITPATLDESELSLSYQLALLAPCAVLLLKP